MGTFGASIILAPFSNKLSNKKNQKAKKAINPHKKWISVKIKLWKIDGAVRWSSRQERKRKKMDLLNFQAFGGLSTDLGHQRFTLLSRWNSSSWTMAPFSFVHCKLIRNLYVISRFSASSNNSSLGVALAKSLSVVMVKSCVHTIKSQYTTNIAHKNLCFHRYQYSKLN